MGKFNPTGYSADVQLWLVSDQHRIPLTHSGDTFVIAANPVEMPPCDAKIIVMVDSVQFERPVRLAHGMSQHIRQTAVHSIDQIAPF